MCIICTSTLAELKTQKRLYCAWCTKLEVIPELPSLLGLNCRRAPNLKVISELPSLKHLSCGGCTSLESIPVLPSLRELNCMDCISLEVISEQPSLRVLNVMGCTSLKVYPVLPFLEHLYITQDHNWISRVQLNRVVKIQRYLKKSLQLRVIGRSREWIEWYYNPNNVGGKMAKIRLEKMFS